VSRAVRSWREKIYLIVKASHVSLDALELERDPVNFERRAALPLRTPLHVAVQVGPPNLVGYLLQLGANPHIRDTVGMTPLEAARASKRPSKVIDLLENAETRYVPGWSVNTDSSREGHLYRSMTFDRNFIRSQV
jgi:hypothetical protein